LLAYEKKANAVVTVPDNKIPKARKNTTPIKLLEVTVRSSIIATPEWLHENLAKVGLVDARDKTAFRSGHIEGATLYDPLRFGLRN
jgi:hypothetical protein